MDGKAVIKKKKKDKKEKRARIAAPPEQRRDKPKRGLFRNVSQVFSGHKELLPKSPRGDPSFASPRSARTRFGETPASIRLHLTDGIMFEGVLLVDDIFENKGVLVDLVFRAEQIELTSPSSRLKLPSTVQRFLYSSIPSFRLYDKLYVWEFQWLEPPNNEGGRSSRRVFKFKDLKFKELNETARTFVAESLEVKRIQKEASEKALRESASTQKLTASPSDSRSDRTGATPDRSSVQVTPRDQEEEKKRDARFTELYFDICDILLEETADGEYVTLADLADMVSKDRLPWTTAASAEDALWEFCSLYPETFSLEEDETDRLVVGLLSMDEMITRLEDHIMASPLRRARPAVITHTVFSREVLRDFTLDQFVQRGRVFKWHDGNVVMRKSAVIDALRYALAQKQEELDNVRHELEKFKARRARKDERRRRRIHAQASHSPSPSPPPSPRPASVAVESPTAP